MQPVFCMINITGMKKEAGFTIIELLVTIVVTGLVVAAIASLIITIGSAQRSTQLLETATRAGERQIESLRNNMYNTLEPGVDIDFTDELPAQLPDPKSGTVEVSEPTEGLRRVDVTITYQDGRRERNVQLSSVIGQLGIGQ